MRRTAVIVFVVLAGFVQQPAALAPEHGVMYGGVARSRTTGELLTGSTSIAIRLYAASVGGSALAAEAFAPSLVDGGFQVGAAPQPSMDVVSSVFAELVHNSQPLAPRIPLRQPIAHYLSSYSVSIAPDQLRRWS